MKKLSLLIAAVLGLGVLAPVSAEAGTRSRVTVESCGTRVFWELCFSGRDCHGAPIFKWVVIRRVPPCRESVGHRDHGRFDGYRESSYRDRDSYRSRYSDRGHGDSCRPSRGYSSRYGR